MNITYRFFDLSREDPSKLWHLYQNVYGSDAEIRKRWAWEISQHPLADKLRVIVAEINGLLIGQSVRLPVDLVTERGLISAEFAVNSMVHPDYRGNGVIQKIYRLGFEAGILQLSKGTAPGMYRLLMSMGYNKIKPDTFMTALLRPFSWGCSKVLRKTMLLPSIKTSSTKTSDDGFSRIENFTDTMTLPVMPELICCRKNIDYLNWRYLASPQNKYHCYVLGKCGVISAWYILHYKGSTAYLVDLGWDSNNPGVLDDLIKSAKMKAKHYGAIKITFWGTNDNLRNKLSQYGFRERLESPGFSFFSGAEDWASCSWNKTHFVHGDGDIDYL